MRLAVLVENFFEWGDVLPCRSHDPELFFTSRSADVELAKSLCRSCPVRAACLAGAVARREPWGVWGGEVFEEGVIVAGKRPRGRPRKPKNDAPLADSRGPRPG